MRLGRAPVTIQLSRLALAGRTGVLRVPGDNLGTIHLCEGEVTGAQCRGTPDVASRLARWSTALSASAPDTLTREWVIREAIADAALAMLPHAARSARFTAGNVPGPDSIAAVPVAELLAEVNRRHKVLQQLPAALTADTVVARSPQLRERGVRVSAMQRTLLMRMNDLVTPRTLAMASGTSVFTTTLQVFRLITMDMVAIVGGSRPEQRTFSFTRAATD
jgi:hypothetical protein